ncbi:DUF6515 family protein [Desulfogranum marinum]|uniref:DUF6515 family protein n=1 Tax=Desulfogranum marinum TaxID=453220 RepID=UPI0029C6A9B3|nr:DUF6515 family protein [Desulfogranum marinum]
MIKIYPKSLTPLIAGTTAALFLLTSVAVSPSEAGPRPHGVPFPGGAANTIMFGKLTYFFVDGIFYTKKPTGYVVAPAPIGAKIPVLPPAAVIVNIDGRPYYTYSGTFYQQVPGGYIVVKQPSSNMISHFKQRQKLTVIVESLNVRSGPGKENPVLRHVSQGEVLVVEDVKAGWCLVKLPDNSSGWVMSQYTATIKAEPKG